MLIWSRLWEEIAPWVGGLWEPWADTKIYLYSATFHENIDGWNCPSVLHQCLNRKINGAYDVITREYSYWSSALNNVAWSNGPFLKGLSLLVTDQNIKISAWSLEMCFMWPCSYLHSTFVVLSEYDKLVIHNHDTLHLSSTPDSSICVPLDMIIIQGDRNLICSHILCNMQIILIAIHTKYSDRED